jgi:hypothetical protein
MRHSLVKLALTTALVTGGVLVAQACPYTTASKDPGLAMGKIQLAQSSGGGSSGGSSSGSGSSTGGTGGSSSTGTTTAPGTGTNPSAGGGGGSGTVIPQNQPMRQPGTPTQPTAPGQPNR